MKIHHQIILPLVISVLVFSCETKSTEDSGLQLNPGDNQILVTQAQFDRGGMKTGKITRRKFSERVIASGMIDVPPQNRVEITAFFGGFIKAIPHLVGTEVKRGDMLAELENPEFLRMQQEFLEISGQMDYLKAEFERQKKLYEENITSQKNFLKAESDYKRASATIAGHQSRLEMLNISPEMVLKGNLTSRVILRAPINGTITHVNVSRGTYVNPQDIILEIVDPEHKHLELKVYEKDVLKISEGQEILFAVPEASEEVFAAHVALVGKSIDEQSRTVNVHGHLSEEDEARFTVGMFVEAEIVRNETEKYALPETAVMGTARNKFILVLKSEADNALIFERTEITAGEAQNGFIPLKEFPDTSAVILFNGGFSVADQSE